MTPAGAPTADAAVTTDELVSKLYTNMARLAAEIALERCRNRALLGILREKLGVTDADMDARFRDEVGEHLEQFCHDITAPMLADLDPGPGCCGGAG